MAKIKYDYLQATMPNGGMPLPFDWSDEDDERFVLYVHVYSGEIDVEESSDVELAGHQGAEWVFSRHNQDGRPRRDEVRSMSVGDVVVIHGPRGPIVLIYATFGFAPVKAGAAERLLSAARRKAYTGVPVPELMLRLEERADDSPSQMKL